MRIIVEAGWDFFPVLAEGVRQLNKTSNIYMLQKEAPFI